MVSSDPWGLILAGGDGIRLQALTRALTGAPIPKQYCRITGDRSLLEATLARIASVLPPARTLAIVNHDHLALATDQLRALPARNMLVQPRNCDTGPGLLFSLLRLRRRRPGDAIVAVFPSDHHVRDDRAFLAYLGRALTLDVPEARLDAVRRHAEQDDLLGQAPHASQQAGFPIPRQAPSSTSRLSSRSLARRPLSGSSARVACGTRS
jgi:hypothetical protein